MNPLTIIREVARQIPPKVRFWLYVVLAVWLVIEYVFDLVPVDIETKITAVAAALGFSVASLNVAKP